MSPERPITPPPGWLRTSLCSRRSIRRQVEAAPRVSRQDHGLRRAGRFCRRRRPGRALSQLWLWAPQVKVMASIRRPKRLIIRGDDERDHPVLVKSGEDLRQDQRIQQLLAVMNILLGNDAACAQRALRLRTYQVIPLTTRWAGPRWVGGANQPQERNQPLSKRALSPTGSASLSGWRTRAR